MGFNYFPKFFFYGLIAWIHIGMVLACQFTVGFSDNLRGRARFNPQDLVVIFVAFGHRQQKPFC